MNYVEYLKHIEITQWERQIVGSVDYCPEGLWLRENRH